MSDHSITNHMAFYDVHGPPDLISKDLNAPRVLEL